MVEQGVLVAPPDRSSTFADNLSLPIHRWFRYSAGFSANWVAREVEQMARSGPVRVLDPFSGAGTVLVEAERLGAAAFGVEAHPFVARIASAKLAWRVPVDQFCEMAGEVIERAKASQRTVDGSHPALIVKCFPPDVLAELDALKQAWMELADESSASELVWLAITAVLRSCSPVGTAQWQYVLPNKSKARTLRPYEAFRVQIELMSKDIRIRQMDGDSAVATPLCEDARSCASVPDGWANLVLTSPPYMNNYDYADATRLEMSFWGDIRSWGDLHAKVRTRLMRSCTQHLDADKSDLEVLLDDENLRPIAPDIRLACDRLAEERLTHGGKKSYHLLVAAYFADLARVWKALRRVTADGGRVCFVIGDSAPYGVHVAVDQWLGELAVAAGFQSYQFQKTRDRNVKWRNRKHRVPLHEGRLWVEG
jgi:DNA modification methylase